MKTLLVLVLLTATCAAQNRIETIANVSVRAADAAQTCYNLAATPYWRERLLPTQSCAAVVGISAGYALGAWSADRWLIRHHHERLAHFQIVSAAGAGFGIAYTFSH